MSRLAGVRHPSRSADVPAELFVRGRTIGDCWIRDLSISAGASHNELRCCCGWSTSVPLGGEHHLTAALHRWWEHAQQRAAEVPA